MRHVVALVLGLALTGCAGSLPRAIDAAEAGLVGLDVVVEDTAPLWGAYVEAQIEHCKAQGHTTREAGEACLGPAAKARDVEAALEAVTAAQSAALEALEGLRKIAPVLEAAKDARK